MVRYFCSNDNLVADTDIFMIMSEIWLRKSMIPILKQLMCIPMLVLCVKQCDKIDINWKTLVDYDYKVSDSDVSANAGQYIDRVSYPDGYVE